MLELEMWKGTTTGNSHVLSYYLETAPKIQVPY